MKKYILLLTAVFSTNVFAFPTAPIDSLEIDSDTLSIFNTKLMDEDSHFNYDFDGIVKLSNCSGAIIRFAGQPDQSNAYVLTNGHCLGGRLLDPGAVVYNKTLRRRMKVSNADKDFKSITAIKLVYATMTDTDAAIYELQETYADLKDKGVEPFELDSVKPLIGIPIDIVSGYWERGYRCHIAANVFELREHVYLFTDSIRYSDEGCKIIGGTSGSPVISQGTRTVVAVNNTSNVDGLNCALNNPCEVDDEGNVQVLKAAGYGQQTYKFYTCLTEDFRIDLSKEGCSLPMP